MSLYPKRFLRTAILAAGIVLSHDAPTRADTFLLANGGRIDGEWLNRDALKVPYIIRLEEGTKLTVERAFVREVIRQRPVEVEYEQIAPGFKDTIEEQWKLAEWCRSHTLVKQREQHLRRILELDEKCAPAWRGLGYSQVGGHWVAKDEVPRERGLELFKGRWRTKQEIQILEEQAKAKLVEGEWEKKLRRWRREFVFGEKPHLAQADILNIRDPYAVRPLADFLASENSRQVALLYVETLGKLASPEAQQVLVSVTLNHRDVEVVHAAVEEVLRIHPFGVVETYTKMLKNDNNLRVNRAAFVLAKLGDKSAMGPLIDALVTSHSQIIPAQGNADTMTASFGSMKDGSGNNLSSGPSFSRGQGPAEVIHRVQNQEVLNSLIRLSGTANFGFDLDAWKIWYGVQKRSVSPAETRRD